MCGQSFGLDINPAALDPFLPSGYRPPLAASLNSFYVVVQDIPPREGLGRHRLNSRTNESLTNRKD